MSEIGTMSSRVEMECDIIKAKDNNNSNDVDAPASAPSEELKHATLSDKISENSLQYSVPNYPKSENQNDPDKQTCIDSDQETVDRADISSHEEVAGHNFSPKKKRNRDQVEDVKSRNEINHDDSEAIHASIAEPEKKRPRDMSKGSSNSPVKETIFEHDELAIKKEDRDSLNTPEKNVVSPAEDLEKKPLTFANSGFASLAASKTSPFGSLGTTKASIFGGTGLPPSSALYIVPTNSSAIGLTTSFGTLSSDKHPAGLAFCNSKSESDNHVKGGLFGSNLASTFGSVTGPRLSSFAGPGMENKPLISKPAKAFGAPESDNEDILGTDAGSNANDQDNPDDECFQVGCDEKKKIKTAKIQIDDGETGEITILQIRAKLFAFESKATGWKERGVGTLKINVPKSSASYHENGIPIPGSFDKSRIESSDNNSGSRLARLIMRQENTHRVILNTFIIREMEFEEKSAISSAQIIFTAFEGEKELKPIKMLLKISESNAKLFRSEIDSIQHGLRANKEVQT